ncbi:MAG: nitroreductase/quinone reductase family protein [Dermatophilaceae bacterium]
MQRRLYVITRGRISLTGHAPVLLLTTVGRRTGRERTIPLFYLRDDNRLVVCNVNPGLERPNPWTLNLIAEPHALVTLGSETYGVTARKALQDEVDSYWPRFTKLWPAYQTFADRGGTISVFILEPAHHRPVVA